METENKKNSILIVIVLLVAILFSIIGWMLGKNYANKENNLEKQKIEEKNKTSEDNKGGENNQEEPVPNGNEEIPVIEDDIPNVVKVDNLPLGDDKYEWTISNGTPREKFNKYFDNIDKIPFETLESDYGNNTTQMEYVKNEVSKLFAFINGQITTDDLSIDCGLLNYFFEYDSRTSDRLLALQPEIMECLYNLKHIYVYDNEYGGSHIISSKQYDFLKEFFATPVELNRIEDDWSDYPLTTDNDWDAEYMNSFYYRIKPYFNKNYYYAHTIGDGYGYSNVYFELVNIVRNNSIYTINMNVYRENDSLKVIKGTAKLEVEIFNGHIKYHQLIINK